MPDLKEISDRLKYLGSQPETPEARAEVEAAFAMKWEGIHAVAEHVLGKWGGRRSVDMLSQLLQNHRENSKGFGVQHAAVHALMECYEPQDIPWILDIYYSGYEHYYLGQLTRTLRFPEVQSRIIEETRNATPMRRKAALEAIYLLRFPNACEIFGQMVSDSDKEISQLANRYFNQLCADSNSGQD